MLQRAAKDFAVSEQMAKGRWNYEEPLKRHFFMAKPMDQTQLSAWRAYLDFEENEGHADRIVHLYQRCLVPCACYEEFWLRYVRYLATHCGPEDTMAAFKRGLLFIGRERTALRLAYAQFLELQGQHDEARALYQNVCERVPNHLETIVQFSNFERRQKNVEAACGLLIEASRTVADIDVRAVIVVMHACLVQHTLNGVEKAEALYESHWNACAASRYFVLHYLDLERNRPGDAGQATIELIYARIRAQTSLAFEDRRDIGLRVLEYLQDRAADLRTVKTFEERLIQDGRAEQRTNKRPSVSDERVAKVPHYQ